MSRLHEALTLYFLFGMLWLAIGLAVMTEQDARGFEQGLNKHGVKIGRVVVAITVVIWVIAWLPVVLTIICDKVRNVKS